MDYLSPLITNEGQAQGIGGFWGWMDSVSLHEGDSFGQVTQRGVRLWSFTVGNMRNTGPERIGGAPIRS